jgi:hypothetical protein
VSRRGRLEVDRYLTITEDEELEVEVPAARGGAS